MKRQRIKSAVCLLCVVCACLFAFCGCSSARDAAATADTTAEQESTAPAVTEPEEKEAADEEPALKPGVVMWGKEMIEQVEGVEVVYGRVERVSGSMIYAPTSGSGYFTINGTIADDSMIEITIHPTSILRYNVTLNVKEEKTVKAEIRVFKKGEQLVACENPETVLVQGANTVDVCVDTGEGAPCHGTYELHLYLDGRLVRIDEYEA